MKPIEQLPNAADLEEKVKEAEEVLRKRRNLWPILRHALGMDHTKTAELTNSLNTARAQALWRKERVSAPRCLSCGHTNVTPMDWPWTEQGEAARAIKFLHPSCGGQIFVASGPGRIALRLKTRIFDCEGIKIKEEPLAARNKLEIAAID